MAPADIRVECGPIGAGGCELGGRRAAGGVTSTGAALTAALAAPPTTCLPAEWGGPLPAARN